MTYDDLVECWDILQRNLHKMNSTQILAHKHGMLPKYERFDEETFGPNPDIIQSLRDIFFSFADFVRTACDEEEFDETISALWINDKDKQ